MTCAIKPCQPGRIASQSYQEETNGTLTITIKDASTEITLVSGHEYGELGYDTTEHQLTYTDYQGSTYGDFELSAGRLNGLMTEYRLPARRTTSLMFLPTRTPPTLPMPIA